MGLLEKIPLNLSVLTGPVAEPWTVDEIKAKLRITGTDEDSLIPGMISGCRQQAEMDLNRMVGEQTLLWLLPGFPSANQLLFPKPPLISLQKIRYRVLAGTYTTLYDATVSPPVTSSLFEVETRTEPGFIFLKPSQSWPSAELYEGFPVEITFKCGVTTASQRWKAILAAMELLVGHVFEHRESIVIGSLGQMNALASAELPQGYWWGIQKHRCGLYDHGFEG